MTKREDPLTYNAQWRVANPDKVAKYVERNREDQRKRAAFIADLKIQSGCVDCGYKDHHAALDFDHVVGEKSFSISHNKMTTMKKLLDEITKCEVVCANCHRIRTFNRNL